MKPNNFPVRASLDGTEEIYTQTNDVAEKFTLDDVKTFSSQNLSDVLSNDNAVGQHYINFDEPAYGLLFQNGSLLKQGTNDAGLGSANGISQICSIGYELKWEAGRLYVMEQGGTVIRQSLYNLNNTPSSNDDDTKGYIVGSLWTLDNGVTYICTDNTSGFADWKIYSPFTLENVLNQGNSTGGNQITSPDANTTLEVYDGSLELRCTDNINTQNNILIQPAQIEYLSTDLSNNDNTYIVQNFSNVALTNSSAGGNQVNGVGISQTKVGLENNLNGTQIQEIYVDSDTCNMGYQDGINIIDVELGLTNGFRARQTINSNDFENYIQVTYGKVHLKYNDLVGGVVREVKIDADGIFLSGIPSFDDDAAAGTAGLPAGYVFKTTGSGAIAVAGVLCIKQ
jgi:hypothetical protein